MQYGHYRTRIKHLAANGGLAFVLLGSVFHVSTAYGVGTAVNANVCDQNPGVLSISAPAASSTVTESTPVISGRVARLSQIRTYVNGTFHTTVPLDTGSTTFSYTTNLTPGQNTIRLVGVDPCSANSPEATISLVYDPKAPINPVAQVVDQTKSGASEAVHYMNAQVSEAAQTKPAAGLSGAVYSAMQALDLAPATSSPEAINHMTQRFSGIVGGSVLVLFAHPLLTAYHLVRYRLMQWNIHAFPEFVRFHALFALRAVGAVLFIGSFFI